MLQQHPNADRLKVCDVDIGEESTVKVVCGAPNARKGLVYSICRSRFNYPKK